MRGDINVIKALKRTNQENRSALSNTDFRNNAVLTNEAKSQPWSVSGSYFEPVLLNEYSSL